MFLAKPKIFSNFPEIVFGFSKKLSGKADDKYNFNMSFSIYDEDKMVEQNRTVFFNELDLNEQRVVIQKQVHSDIVNTVDGRVKNLQGDALITKRKNIGLAVSTADCPNIFLYDPVNSIISAVHSGWAGTEKKILSKVMNILQNNFGTNASDLHVYFGPSISQKNYEVGLEFRDKFDEKYLIPSGEKFKLDLKNANLDLLEFSGVPTKQIEVSDICSFENDDYHSYRRDGKLSGRALGIIAMRD